MTTTYNQAKRLKELGFNQKVTAYYVDGSLDYNSPVNWNTNEGLDENGEHQEEDGYCSAPSISEALQWIRENKDIDCCVFYNNELFGDFEAYLENALKSHGYLFPTTDEQMSVFEENIDYIPLPKELESPDFGLLANNQSDNQR